MNFVCQQQQNRLNSTEKEPLFRYYEINSFYQPKWRLPRWFSKKKKYRYKTHLFVKVPRPGNNEGTFSVFYSSCRLLLPV